MCKSIAKIVITILGLVSCLFTNAQTKFLDVTDSKGFLDFDPPHTYGSGATAVDYDGDGNIDLYLSSTENDFNRLYRNIGDGGFMAMEVGVSSTLRTRAALWFDYDGDHRLDLFIAGDCYPDLGVCDEADKLKLFKQLPNGTFEDVTSDSGLLTGDDITRIFGGVASGDINNDGYLDLITTYWRGKVNLYLNRGDGTFENISASSGIEGSNKFWQPLIYDLDQNGWADIFLPVDLDENLFWANNQDNTFRELGEVTSLNNSFNDMGIGLGDFDNDNDLDLYITSRETEFGWHNVLLRNNGDTEQLGFDEVSIDAGVDEGGWGWGVTFIDIDNNGLLDIAATNGYTRPIDGERSKLWKNQGDGSFTDISDISGYDDIIEATTFISFDYDRDGDLDIAQTLKENEGQSVAFRLFENQADLAEDFGNYLVVKPRMVGANHWSIGSLVRIRIGEEVKIRPITAGISTYGQEPAEAFFGIADATLVDEVTIVWPGGEETSVTDISANQIITLTDENVLHSPTGLAAYQGNDLFVELNWGHMSTNQTAYIVERSLEEDFAEIQSFSVGSTEKSYVDTDVDPFTSYYYRVRSAREALFSGSSAVVLVTTNSGVIINAPSNLSGTLNSESSITLSWNDNADNEIGYIVQRSLDENFSQFLEFDFAENTSEFTDSNVEPRTTYYYRVKAYGDDTQSAFGDAMAITTTILGVDSSISKFNIYPNPSNGSFRLDISPELHGPIQITIANELGQLIGSYKFKSKTEAEQNGFHLNSLQRVCFVILETGDSVSVEKLLLKDK